MQFQPKPSSEQEARSYKKYLYRIWKDLPESERKLFVAVCKAYKKNKMEGRFYKGMQLPEWVTRQQIADELGSYTLIPYYVKLLDHLTDGRKHSLRSSRKQVDGLRWIDAKKRSRFRVTYEGIRRPAGYEWVYLPDMEKAMALLEMEDEAKNPARRDEIEKQLAEAEEQLRIGAEKRRTQQIYGNSWLDKLRDRFNIW